MVKILTIAFVAFCAFQVAFAAPYGADAPSSTESLPTEAPSSTESLPTEAPSSTESLPTEAPSSTENVPTEAPIDPVKQALAEAEVAAERAASAAKDADSYASAFVSIAIDQLYKKLWEQDSTVSTLVVHSTSSITDQMFKVVQIVNKANEGFWGPVDVDSVATASSQEIKAITARAIEAMRGVTYYGNVDNQLATIGDLKSKVKSLKELALAAFDTAVEAATTAGVDPQEAIDGRAAAEKISATAIEAAEATLAKLVALYRNASTKIAPLYIDVIQNSEKEALAMIDQYSVSREHMPYEDVMDHMWNKIDAVSATFTKTAQKANADAKALQY